MTKNTKNVLLPPDFFRNSATFFEFQLPAPLQEFIKRIEKVLKIDEITEITRVETTTPAKK